MDKARFNYLYMLVAILGVLLLHDAIVRFQQVAPIPYSDFQRLLREGRVKEVVVTADRIQGEFKEPEGGKRRLVTNRVEQDLVEEAFRNARGVLERNRALLEAGSRLLPEEETLSESDLERLFGKGIVPPGPDGEIPHAGTAGSA